MNVHSKNNPWLAFYGTVCDGHIYWGGESNVNRETDVYCHSLDVVCWTILWTIIGAELSCYTCIHSLLCIPLNTKISTFDVDIKNWQTFQNTWHNNKITVMIELEYVFDCDKTLLRTVILNIVILPLPFNFDWIFWTITVSTININKCIHYD